MFKVGDKVKILENGYSTNYIGEIDVVIGVDGSNKKPLYFLDKVGLSWYEEELELVEEPIEIFKDKGEEIMELQGTIPKIVDEDTSQFISMDYRTEYYKKVEECEKLKAQLEWLWDSILHKKD